MTLFIIGITTAISIIAFSRRDWFEKLLFNPYRTYHCKEWHRLLTHGALHVDWMHLIVNMLVLLSFGPHVEKYFVLMSETTWLKSPSSGYLFFYLSALVVSSLGTLRKHRDHEWYNSAGASGAVSAVLFCSIFFEPRNTLLLMGIIPIKAYVFGPLYLIYSYYSARRESGNVNHDAHWAGAIFGFCFPLLIDVGMIRWLTGQFH
ncbi:MAG: rhomboid family intramembrane serine protease [Bacteroidales bacterium]|jgi:membrane associated rhomboid family serine protease|nr:rhomboid family intramembrane serine protease [Bacteroidales bacterium]